MSKDEEKIRIFQRAAEKSQISSKDCGGKTRILVRDRENREIHQKIAQKTRMSSKEKLVRILPKKSQKKREHCLKITEKATILLKRSQKSTHSAKELRKQSDFLQQIA